MSLQKRNQERLVIRVNKLYHDFESREYQHRHPEIFQDEVERWKKIAEKYLRISRPITILDVGTGTGFVPLTIAPFLKRGDTIICSDISAKMFEVCRKNIADKEFDCQFEFIKLSGSSFPLEGDGVDIVTVNSVLHHIFKVDDLFREIDKLVREGGLVIICHEHNKLFFENILLLHNYLFFRQLFDIPNIIRSAMSQTLKKLGLISKIRSLIGQKKRRFHSNIFLEINNQLIAEGLISTPLTPNEIGRLVDFHSPTAGGGVRKNKGFYIYQLLQENLPNYELVHFETYAYLYKVTKRNWLTRKQSSILATLFPEQGSMFCAILRKMRNKYN